VIPEKIFSAGRSQVKTLFLLFRVGKNVWLLTASNRDGFSRAHNLMEVRFRRREYVGVHALQVHSDNRNWCYENNLGESLIGKLRCVRYPIYMTSMFTKESVDHEWLSYRERNPAQTRYSLWWPAQSTSTTRHQSPLCGLVNSPAHTYKYALT